MEADEGIILQGAERILHGQVLYRDFFSYLTPGSYYLVALVLKVFGDSFTVARTLVAFGGAICAAITYLLARRVCGRGVALGTAALVTLTALPYRFLVLHNWDSTLWACLAVYCSVRWTEGVRGSGFGARGEKREDRRQKTEDGRQKAGIETRNSKLETRNWSFAVGSFVSLTGLFEQSKGVGLALGLGAAFVVLWIGRRRSVRGEVASGKWQVASDKVASSKWQVARQKQSSSYLPLTTNHWPLLLGLAWPVVLTLGWFGAHHALAPMVSDLLWPLHHYTRANSVPYGWVDWNDSERAQLFGNPNWAYTAVVLLAVTPCFLIPVLPLAAVAIFGVLAFRMVRKKPEARRQKAEGSGKWLVVSGKPAEDPSCLATCHLPLATCYYLVVSGALAGLLLSVLVVRANTIHVIYLAPLYYLVLAWALDGRDVPGTLFRVLRPGLRWLVGVTFGLLAVVVLFRTLTAHVRIPTRRGVVEAPAADTVIPYVDEHVPAGSPMLVYPYLPLYYYLTGTFSPTPYEYIQFGMHTPEQMAEVVRALDRDQTPVALYETDFVEKVPTTWPETPAEALARDPVGDYLMKNYRPCRLLHSASGWRFLFMVRKGTTCPRN
jgi:Dolichyl-phosphate-mannose-protein mannosyltransferase